MDQRMSHTHHHSKRYRKGHKAKLWHDGGWLKREPKSWRRIYKHKRRRAHLREAIHRYKAGDEDVAFPQDKKPWVYYY